MLTATERITTPQPSERNAAKGRTVRNATHTRRVSCAYATGSTVMLRSSMLSKTPVIRPMSASTIARTAEHDKPADAQDTHLVLGREIKGGAQTTDDQSRHLVQRHCHPVGRIPLGVRTIDAVRGEQGDEQGEGRDEAAGNVINACLVLVLDAYRIVQYVLELPAQRSNHRREPHVGAPPHYLGDRRALYRARHAPEVGREVCDRHGGPAP
eukprot:scaffold57472_cov66-Phaeocystis_antarctica.AAC.2